MTEDELAELQKNPALADRYLYLLEKEVALKSPLDLATLMFPETRRWPHLELLNDYLIAWSEYRLTAEGPVPQAQVSWWYVPLQGKERVYVASPDLIPEETDNYGADTPKGPVVFRLSISMRPRAGKSRLVTEVLPFWLQLQAGGELQVGLATYSDSFAADWGGQARDFALAYHPGHTWFPNAGGGLRAARETFNVEGHSGKIRYVGVGGGITGKTLNILIADDTLKNSAEAESEATRIASHNFYSRTWTTRKTRDLTPGARYPIPLEIIMATRWHADDIIGYACYDPDTREPRDDWCILNIPALSKGDGDPLNRPAGEAHPNAAGETKADLERIREDDPRGFAALYQGDPSPEGGGLIPSNFGTYWLDPEGHHVFWRGREDPSDYTSDATIMTVALADCLRFTALDMAATKSTTADWTVGFACAYSREYRKLFILDRYKKKITTDEYEQEIIPFLVDNKATKVIVEGISFGLQVQQLLQRLRHEGHLKFSVEEGPKMIDKVARVLTSGLPSMMRYGQVLLPKGALYRDDLEAEIGLFPYDKHDDQVDALSFAAWWCQQLPNWTERSVKKVPSLVEEIDAHVEKEHKKLNRRKRRDLWSHVGR